MQIKIVRFKKFKNIFFSNAMKHEWHHGEHGHPRGNSGYFGNCAERLKQ
jgi:hypothetical protein